MCLLSHLYSVHTVQLDIHFISAPPREKCAYCPLPIPTNNQVERCWEARMVNFTRGKGESARVASPPSASSVHSSQSTPSRQMGCPRKLERTHSCYVMPPGEQRATQLRSASPNCSPLELIPGKMIPHDKSARCKSWGHPWHLMYDGC